MLAACSDNDGGGTQAPPAGTPITFSTDVEKQTTRAYTGSISDVEVLKGPSVGFGVLAYLTDESTWATTTDGKTATTYPAPDFMYNQKVTWGTTNVVTDDNGYTTIYSGWTYTPVKYWPNSTMNATPRRISFFAYAPYESITAAAANTEGITGITNASDKSPWVKYTLGKVGSQTDFLYADPVIDATRNGNGLIEVTITEEGGVTTTTQTYQNVPLVFHHALSSLDIYVQREFDNSTNNPSPHETEDTKIFVNSISLGTGTTGMATSGIFDLEKKEWRTGDMTTTPNQSITLTSNHLVNHLRGTSSDDPSVASELTNIRVYELDKWSHRWNDDGTRNDESGTLPSGVTEVPQKININATTLMLIPQTVTITPTVGYSFVTRDDGLQHDYLIDTEGANGNNSRRYFRRTITATGNTVNLTIEPGKHYTLVCLISAQSVRFEVKEVEDWDFPLRFTTGIVEGEKTTISHTVNEEH